MRIIPFFTSILGLSVISRSSSLPLSNRFEVSPADQTTTGLALPFLPNTCLNPAYAPLNLTEGREISKIEEQSADGIIGKGIIGTLIIGCLARILQQEIRKRNNQLNNSEEYINETIVSLVIDASLVSLIGIEEFLAIAERSGRAAFIAIVADLLLRIAAVNTNVYIPLDSMVGLSRFCISLLVISSTGSALWGAFVEKQTIGGLSTEFVFLVTIFLKLAVIADFKKKDPQEEALGALRIIAQALEKVKTANIKEKEATKENKESAREKLDLAKNELAAVEKQLILVASQIRKDFTLKTPEDLPPPVRELIKKAEEKTQEQQTLSNRVKNILDQGLKTAATIENLAARVCAICTEHFKPDQSVFDHTKNSRHLFHPECMEAWIKEDLSNQPTSSPSPPSSSCPCCREQLKLRL